jgi:hypothetical protein
MCLTTLLPCLGERRCSTAVAHVISNLAVSIGEKKTSGRGGELVTVTSLSSYLVIWL